MENLEQKIYDTIMKNMDFDEINLTGFNYDSPIFGSEEKAGDPCLGLDSVDALELVVMIYKEWNIDVPSEDMHLLGTVNKIADYIRAHAE
jgi:acyl carrier protein